MAAYHEYLSFHPDFDNESIETPTAEPPPPLSENDRDEPVSDRFALADGGANLIKLDNGIAISNPVIVEVLIKSQKADAGPNSWNGCSGTFVNRNWILTSAHCVAESLDDTSSPAWWSGGRWMKLQVFRDVIDSDHMIVDKKHPGTQFLWGWGVFHPNFKGTADVGYDVALFYLYPDYYDDVLLDQFDGPSSVGAFRITMRPPSIGDQYQFWGYGPASNTVLKVGIGFVDESTITWDIDTSNGYYGASFSSYITSTNWSLVAHPCKGDSGGPATQVVLTSAGPRYVITGIHSAKSPANGEYDAGPLAGCMAPPPAGSRYNSLFTRADIRMDFVEAILRAWPHPLKTCTYETYTGQSPWPGLQKTARCWGWPCQEDDDCNDGEECIGGGNSSRDGECKMRAPQKEGGY